MFICCRVWQKKEIPNMAASGVNLSLHILGCDVMESQACLCQWWTEASNRLSSILFVNLHFFWHLSLFYTTILVQYSE